MINERIFPKRALPHTEEIEGICFLSGCFSRCPVNARNRAVREGDEARVILIHVQNEMADLTIDAVVASTRTASVVVQCSW